MADNRERRVWWLMRAIAVAAGAAMAWLGCHTMMGDGISYLETGQALLRGDWYNGVNPVWSPLYGFLLALFAEVARPEAQNQYFVVHAVGFCMYLLTLWRFDALLRTLVQAAPLSPLARPGPDTMPLPRNLMIPLAYLLFLWCSLGLVGVETTTPDMAVMALLLSATGMMLRAGSGNGTVRHFAILGLMLGVGYLVKTVMLPLAFVFIAVAAVQLHGDGRKRLRYACAALCAFLAPALPFVIALSMRGNGLTIGDAGRVNYMWYVASDAPVRLQPVETLTHKVSDNPAVYSFTEGMPDSAGKIPEVGTRQACTYHPWNHPWYWLKQFSPRFDIGAQMGALRRNAVRLAGSLSGPYSMILAGLFVAFIFSSRAAGWRALRRTWVILAPALCLCLLYLPVLVHPRYVAGAALIIWLWIATGLRTASVHSLMRRVLPGCGLAVVCAVAVGLLIGDAAGQYPAHRALYRQIVETNRALYRAGLHPGDAVGSVGYRIYAARLAGLRITATTLEAGDWYADTAAAGRMAAGFRRAGVAAVIADDLPAGVALPAGWICLPGTRAAILPFRVH